MAKYPKAFDKLYVNMINAGEAGGVLDLILSRLADFMEKAAKLKKKVIGAMIYPAVVISIAVGIVSMIMIFVIPKFETDLQGLQAPSCPASPRSCWPSAAGSPTITAGRTCLFARSCFVLLMKLIRISEGGKYAVDAGQAQDSRFWAASSARPPSPDSRERSAR